MLVGIAEKVFKVTGQRSRSQQDQIHFCRLAAVAIISTAYRRGSLVQFYDYSTM